jgi:hypothetical protein
MIITNRNFVLEENYLETIQTTKPVEITPINIPTLKQRNKIKYEYFIIKYYI